MPRFFFHITDAVEHPDTEGTMLPDLDSCRVEAVAVLGQLIQDRGREFWEADEWSVRVTDDRGLALFEIFLGAVEAPAVGAAKLSRG